MARIRLSLPFQTTRSARGLCVHLVPGLCQANDGSGPSLLFSSSFQTRPRDLLLCSFIFASQEVGFILASARFISQKTVLDLLLTYLCPSCLTRCSALLCSFAHRQRESCYRSGATGRRSWASGDLPSIFLSFVRGSKGMERWMRSVGFALCYCDHPGTQAVGFITLLDLSH